MEDLIEDVSFKSLSYEELYETEKTEDKEEKLCISSECIFARWIKPARIRQLMFVSKDVLLIHVGKTLIFYNLRTHKEDLLIVGGNKMTPDGGDALPLDGITCVDCGDVDLLALAEQPPNAKVIICRYPDLKVLVNLIDSNNSAAYKSVLFLKLEYLIGLRDYPAFDLIIWAWRIQEKLFVVNTEFIQPNQHLLLLATGREVYLSQMERDVRCKLQLWTMFISCKMVYANKTMICLPDNMNVESSCWTSSGWFVFCDSLTNVYRTQPGMSNSEMCVESAENYSEQCVPLMHQCKQGFMMYTAGNLMCFRDTKGAFTKMWSISINHTLQRIVVAGENDVYGWSDQGALIEFTQKKENILKLYGMNIKHFTFIKPTDEIIATINEKNILQLWNVSTGEFKNEIKLNGIAKNVCSNPYYSYIVILFKCGKLELLRSNPKVNDLEYISKIVLCDEELSTVHFLFEGKKCIVISFSTGRFYYISIKLGQMCSVIKEYHLGKQIVDTELIDKKTSSFLTVLYTNQKMTEVSGNYIKIFDSNFNTVFELNNSQLYYTSIFKWISCDVPDIINIACTVMLSKQIQSMTININQAKILELNNIQLDHNLRSVKVFSGENHYVTYSFDGTYNLYEFDEERQWKKIITVNCSHWQTGGLIAAQVNVNAQNILTLSHQGNFMCTSFKKTCNHSRRFYETDIPIIIVSNSRTEGIGFEDPLETSTRMTWTKINENNKINESKVSYNKHTNYIIEEFKKIKKELLTLLEININGPDDTKINIEEFDLNIDYRLEFREKCKIERYEYELKILDDINKLKIETENIIKEYWESLFIKPKSIYCLKKIYKVDNYPISITDQEVIKRANAIIEKRILMKDEDEYLSSLDTPFSRVYTDIYDDETIDSENNDKSLLGSNSHKIINIIEQMNFQHSYYKLDMAKDEQMLLKLMINKLKHSFNKLFDDMFIEKQHLLDTLKGYNDRLRVIESEFRLACKIEPTEPSPVDYEWNQYEKTEQLIRVEVDEVSVKFHNEFNKQMTVETSLDNKQNAQLSDLENFRRRALITMMDGVLEKKWEDELKKDVPKPQCMLTKELENYTEEDFKTINQYEDLVVQINNERMKYKKILEEEKIKINRHINENIEQFDENVFNLFQIKLKYNSAINQEYLKIVRLSKMLSDSEQRKRQIKIYEENCLEVESDIANAIKQIEKTETTYSYLLNTIETLNHKNNVLNKRFKSELPSKLIYDQALIAYNRRPKVLGSKMFSPLIGYQFVNTIIDPSNDKLDLLCQEFVKYLDTLRIYDDFKYVEDYKLNIDRETWQKVCNFRRIKIESEFKVSTFQKDAIDKSNLLDTLMRDKKNKEIMIEKLKLSMLQLENQDYIFEDDPKFQLVIKQGNAEIDLTGHILDFHNTTLITKNYIEDVNAEIKDMGKSKIDVLSKLMAFRGKCRLLKWEHMILKKHKTTLYKYRYDIITSMKVTENIIHYLKFKAKGINIAKHAEQKVDKELTAIHTTYSREKNDLMKRLDELVNKISNIKKENEKIDISINKMHIQLSEAKKKIDYSLTNRPILIRDIRMKNIVKRAQMITNIQELHNEIVVLHTELELLLLKTFPTLYSTPKSSSKTK